MENTIFEKSGNSKHGNVYLNKNLLYHINIIIYWLFLLFIDFYFIKKPYIVAGHSNVAVIWWNKL